MLETRRGGVRPRPGFNMIELLFALLLLGILFTFGAPRLAAAREHAAVRSARQQVQGYLQTARATAMQRGTPAIFHASSVAGSIWVVDNSADTVASKRSLASEYDVTLSSSVAEVRFNSRGFATNLAGNGVIKVTRNGYSDSLCVSRLGAITARCGF
jgi:prepilin-type N-terminal cleavage/methylation domain-containing protein